MPQNDNNSTGPEDNATVLKESYRQFTESYFALMLRILKQIPNCTYNIAESKIFEGLEIPEIHSTIMNLFPKKEDEQWNDTLPNHSIINKENENNTLKQIEQLRKSKGMRYRDAVRAVQLQMLFDHVSVQFPTSQVQMMEMLTKKLNHMYEMLPPTKNNVVGGEGATASNEEKIKSELSFHKNDKNEEKGKQRVSLSNCAKCKDVMKTQEWMMEQGNFKVMADKLISDEMKSSGHLKLMNHLDENTCWNEKSNNDKIKTTNKNENEVMYHNKEEDDDYDYEEEEDDEEDHLVVWDKSHSGSDDLPPQMDEKSQNTWIENDVISSRKGMDLKRDKIIGTRKNLRPIQKRHWKTSIPKKISHWTQTHSNSQYPFASQKFDTLKRKRHLMEDLDPFAYDYEYEYGYDQNPSDNNKRKESNEKCHNIIYRGGGSGGIPPSKKYRRVGANQSLSQSKSSEIFQLQYHRPLQDGKIPKS